MSRGGGLEFAVARADADESTPDLVWRVRLLEVNRDNLVVAHPGAMGHSFEVGVGTPLIGIIAVGQNRWMFHSSVKAVTRGTEGRPQLVVESPQRVERCLRRHSNRISTASINPATVRCWPLLDPASAVAAEMACSVLSDECRAKGTILAGDATAHETLPNVGPGFTASLANVGGGGVGLTVEPDQANALDAQRVFWLSFDFRPVLPAPFGLTARLAHTRIDSAQTLHAGLAFDFARNPGHQNFVLRQFDQFMRASQSARRAA